MAQLSPCGARLHGQLDMRASCPATCGWAHVKLGVTLARQPPSRGFSWPAECEATQECAAQPSLRAPRQTSCQARSPCCAPCRDELRAAWAAFTPLLHAIDHGELSPEPYPAGTRGPPASDVLVSQAGFVKNKDYIWKVEGVDSLDAPRGKM